MAKVGKGLARTANRIIAEQVEGVAKMFVAIDAVRNDPAFHVMAPKTRAAIEGALRVVNGSDARPKVAKALRAVS